VSWKQPLPSYGGRCAVRGAGTHRCGACTPTARSPVWKWPRASPHWRFMRGLNSNPPRDIAVLDVRRQSRGLQCRWACARQDSTATQNLESPGAVTPPARRLAGTCRPARTVAPAMPPEPPALLCGEHDFRASPPADCERRTTVRVLRRFRRTPRRWIDHLASDKDGFLKEHAAHPGRHPMWPWATAR